MQWLLSRPWGLILKAAAIASRQWFRAKTPAGPQRRLKNGVSKLGPKHHEAFHDEAPVGSSPTFSQGHGENLESGGQGDE